MKKFASWLLSHAFLFGVVVFTFVADLLTRTIEHFKDGHWVHGLILSILFCSVVYNWVFKWSRLIK